MSCIAIDRLAFRAANGFQNERMLDLVFFEHEVRFLFCSIGSNWLGYGPASYTPESGCDGMARHFYILQLGKFNRSRCNRSCTASSGVRCTKAFRRRPSIFFCAEFDPKQTEPRNLSTRRPAQVRGHN